MLTIRPATTNDIDSLTDLLQVLFAIEADFHGNAALQRQGLRMILASERSCLMVAERHGLVIGMCSGQLTISTAEGGPALLIEDVIVSEGQRHRGTGKRLLEAVAGWGRARGARRLQLLAATDNIPALQFYQRLGWQSTQLICLRKQP